MAKPSGFLLQRPTEHFKSVLSPGFLPGNKPRPGDIECGKKAALTVSSQSWDPAELQPPLPPQLSPILPGLGGQDPPEPCDGHVPAAVAKQDAIKPHLEPVRWQGRAEGRLAHAGWLLRDGGRLRAELRAARVAAMPRREAWGNTGAACSMEWQVLGGPGARAQHTTAPPPHARAALAHPGVGGTAPEEPCPRKRSLLLVECLPLSTSCNVGTERDTCPRATPRGHTSTKQQGCL